MFAVWAASGLLSRAESALDQMREASATMARSNERIAAAWASDDLSAVSKAIADAPSADGPSHTSLSYVRVVQARAQQPQQQQRRQQWPQQ